MFHERAAARSLRLAVERIGELPRHVVADESKLRQVLGNLLGNAIKFTETGGVAVRVAARGDAADRRLVVEIEDTGRGIAPEEMPRLFQKFEQTESGRRTKGGTGLGLAISREFARLMGGDITASSRSGQGSVFRLELPLKEGSSHDLARKTEERRVERLAAGQSAVRVLVVAPHNGEIRISTELDDREVRVSVADTGPGVLQDGRGGSPGSHRRGEPRGPERQHVLVRVASCWTS